MEPGTHILQGDIVLKLSADGRYLQAEFPSALQREPINLGWFQEQLTQLGMDCFKLNNDAVVIFINQYNDGTKASTVNIAEKVDGEYHIKKADDLMAAYLSVSPAHGGEPVSKETILAEIQHQGICHGLLEASIDEALQNGEAYDVLIAKGEKPLHGKDGYFENLIPHAKDRRPRIDAQGVAHYHDIGEFITVKQGDPLIRRIPAVQGNSGINIKGETVAAELGEDWMFAPNLPGTRIADDDPNVLLAAISGQPVIVEHGAIVETTLVVDKVDLKTGNIKFDGTVMVKGDVTIGMEIKTTGDVYIHGMIEEACRIEAGGDVSVNLGIIGRGSINEENGNPGKGIVRIQCHGTLSAKFIENCIAISGKCIRVAELVAHSDLTAKQEVIVGQKNAKRGQIMGGVTSADLLIAAQTIGTQGNNHTRIEVGSIKKYLKCIDDIEKLLKTKTLEHESLEKVFSQMRNTQTPNKQRPPSYLLKLQLTIDRLSMEISKLKQQKQNIEASLEGLRAAKVQASKQIFGGVELLIADMARKFPVEHVGGTFFVDSKQGKVEFKP